MRAERSRRRFEVESSTRVPSAAAVMDKVRRPSTWPEWQSEIVTTEGPDEVGVGDQVNGEARMLGFAVAGRADIAAVDETSLQEDVIVGIRMRVGYELTRDGDAWRLTHRLTADLPRGLSGRVLSFFLTRRLRRMQRELLRNLPAAAAASDSAIEQRDAEAGV